MAAEPHPHRVLAAAAALVLVCEALRGSATLLTSPLWPALEAAIAIAGLIAAWRAQDRLRLGPLLAIGVAFQLGWISVHLALGVSSDGDSSLVYAQTGHLLLNGTYPSSTYPVGAVLLFALESLFSGGHSDRVANALLMVPWQLVAVVAVWELRTRYSAWLAALVALWPLNAFFWEFKFDLLPTAALVLGLLLAYRRRWVWAGVALGAGAAVKWTPALAGIVLAVWLLRRGRTRDAAGHAVALAGTFLLINLPFLISSPHAVLEAYRIQGGRGIIAESLYYVPPIIPPVKSVAILSHAVGAPRWANAATVVFQVVLLLALVAVTLRVERASAAVALAAMAPVVFLLTNRVFSAQYLVTLTAAWALAAALVADGRRDQLGLGLLIFGASLANALVYPTGVRLWPTFTLILFACGFAATGWIVVRSARLGTPVSR